MSQPSCNKQSPSSSTPSSTIERMENDQMRLSLAKPPPLRIYISPNNTFDPEVDFPNKSPPLPTYWGAEQFKNWKTFCEKGRQKGLDMIATRNKDTPTRFKDTVYFWEWDYNGPKQWTFVMLEMVDGKSEAKRRVDREEGRKKASVPRRHSGARSRQSSTASQGTGKDIGALNEYLGGQGMPQINQPILHPPWPDPTLPRGEYINADDVHFQDPPATTSLGDGNNQTFPTKQSPAN